MWPDVIQVGSACSGMGTEHWAMKDMSERCFQQVFVCEKDAAARSFLEANMPSEVRSYIDVMGDEFQNCAPPCDVFMAGFPCQPFSVAGNGQGIADPKGRGIVIEGIMQYISKYMPRIVVLEMWQAL